jgi:hypothetical protein
MSDKLFISYPKFTFDLCMKEAIIMKPTRVNNAHKKDLSQNSKMFHVNKVYIYEMSITVSTQITIFLKGSLFFISKIVVTCPERKHFIGKNFAFANV